VQGNTFWVDVMVEAPATHPSQEEDLAHTLNYEVIYAIVSRQMEEPVKLLETLCSSILRDLQQAFGDAIHGHITVRKKQPPMLGKMEASLVTLRF
jgi:dihydroneopterin aldolase